MVSEPVQVLMDPARCLSVQNWTVVLCVLQIDAIHRKEAMKAMTETFYAAIFGYDEVRRKQELFFFRKHEINSRSLGFNAWRASRHWSWFEVKTSEVCFCVSAGNPVWWLRPGRSSVEEPVQLSVWRPPAAGAHGGVRSQTGVLITQSHFLPKIISQYFFG